jgi:hypothetical protein
MHATMREGALTLGSSAEFFCKTQFDRTSQMSLFR